MRPGISTHADATYYTAGYWSTDAYLTYDIDGEGTYTWNLAGTPLLVATSGQRPSAGECPLQSP